MSFGCVTQKRCSERFPCLPAQSDSIYIERLDTVLIPIEEDSFVIFAEVPCEDFELKAENSKLLNDLKVVNGMLKQRTKVKPDTVRIFTKDTVTKTVYVQQKEVEYKVPRIWMVLGWFVIAFIIGIVLFILYTIKKVL
jgi:hypothetical protein